MKYLSFLILIFFLLNTCKDSIKYNTDNPTSKVEVKNTTNSNDSSIPDTCLLVFTKTAGFRHDCIPAGIEMMKKICSELNYPMYHTEDATIFNEANMKKFKIIMFLNTSGDILTEEQQKCFSRMIDNNVDFMGIHAAADTEHDWPWYGQLIGAYFKDHPEIQKATLTKKMKNLPGAADLPDKWERTDEWYNFDFVHDEMKILMQIDEKSYKGGKNGDRHPMIWFIRHHKSMIYYNALGHTIESYTEPKYVGQIKNTLSDFIEINRLQARSEIKK